MDISRETLIKKNIINECDELNLNQIIKLYSSYFITNKALFGSYPNQEFVNILEKKNVKYFIDLTNSGEKNIIKYNTTQKYINYPIEDLKVPSDTYNFSIFIVKISNIIFSLNTHEKIYIHCRGGHGRSGLVVACLLVYIYKITPLQAIKKTNFYHNNRIIMKDKWRIKGAPQTIKQKNFVYSFFKPIKGYKNLYELGFLNNTLHDVKINNLGKFHTATSAIEAFKNPTDLDYVSNQEKIKDPLLAKHKGKLTKLRKDWHLVYLKVVYNVINQKIMQNPDIKKNLIDTELKPIIFNQSNIMGNILMKIRDEFYTKLNL